MRGQAVSDDPSEGSKSWMWEASMKMSASSPFLTWLSAARRATTSPYWPPPGTSPAPESSASSRSSSDSIDLSEVTLKWA